MYREGKVVKKDYKRAIDFYTFVMNRSWRYLGREAEKAKYWIARIYKEGLGLEKNEEELAENLLRSVQKSFMFNRKEGSSETHYLLSRMYYYGEGDKDYYDDAVVEKDLVRALMWIALSLENASDASDPALIAERKDFKNELLKEMSPQQIKQAEQLAKTCRKNNFEKC